MGRTRKPQQSRSQRTVDAIVSAGFIEAARGGMEGLTTRRIADTAGVGVGSVYEYFENKEAIVTAMNQRMVDELVGRLRPQIPTLVTLELRSLVVRLLAELRAFLQADGGRYASYLAGQNPRELRSTHARINKLLRDLAGRYIIHHPEYAAVPQLHVISYIAIHGGVAVVSQHLGENPPIVPFDDLVDGLADMVERMAIRPPPEQQQ